MESNKAAETIKFLCSYGGKILPRYTDGELRYVGGLTRVLAVDRSISFAELMVKLGEFCGYSVNLRCQLPSGDLETLISISSDEDLANLVEEYDRASSSMSHPLKIRAVLSPPTSLKKISPPPSMTPSVNFSVPGSPFVAVDSLKKLVSLPARPAELFACGWVSRRRSKLLRKKSIEIAAMSRITLEFRLRIMLLTAITGTEAPKKTQ